MEPTREEEKQINEQENNQNEWQMVKTKAGKNIQWVLTYKVALVSSMRKELIWRANKGNKWNHLILKNDCILEYEWLQPKGEAEGVEGVFENK